MDLAPLNYDQNTLGYCFSKKGCCQKIVHFYQKCNFANIKHIGPTLYTDIFAFYKFEDKNISSLMHWALLASIKIRIPWDSVLIKQVLPENHAFLPKRQFCLSPIAKYMHFREKSSIFYERDDKYISFLNVLNLSLNYDQKTLDYRFSEWWCCQKNTPFLPKITILLRPVVKNKNLRFFVHWTSALRFCDHNWGGKLQNINKFNIFVVKLVKYWWFPSKMYVFSYRA